MLPPDFRQRITTTFAPDGEAWLAALPALIDILRDGEGWRVIDPKGVVGEPAYEVGAFLRNPLSAIAADPRLPRTLERRIAVFAEALALDRQRIHAWAIAQAVLSAWWSYDDDSGAISPGGPAALHVARALATLRP